MSKKETATAIATILKLEAQYGKYGAYPYVNAQAEIDSRHLYDLKKTVNRAAGLVIYPEVEIR